MLIGILMTGHAPDELLPVTGDYDGLFTKLLGGNGFDYKVWKVVEGEFPPGPEAADAWLITGSRHGAYEDHPWIPPLEDLIRAIKASGRPLVGICFGHQIIAQALGGKVEKFAGGWSVGRTTYDMGGQPITLNAWHQDQVTRRPEGAEVLAGNAFCENAVLLYDGVLTIQPHPEFDGGFISGLIDHRSSTVPKDRLARAGAEVDRPTDNADWGARIARFLRDKRIS